MDIIKTHGLIVLLDDFVLCDISQSGMHHKFKYASNKYKRIKCKRDYIHNLILITHLILIKIYIEFKFTYSQIQKRKKDYTKMIKKENSMV